MKKLLSIIALITLLAFMASFAYAGIAGGSGWHRAGHGGQANRTGATWVEGGCA